MGDDARRDLLLQTWASLKGATWAVFERIAASAERLDVTHAQIGLLHVLLQEGSPMTPQEVARQTNVTPGTITSTVNRLEEASLVRRVRESADRRVVHIHVTDAGKALAETWRRTFREHIHDALEPLSDDELRNLTDLLGRVAPPIHGPPGGFGALLRHDAAPRPRKGATKR